MLSQRLDPSLGLLLCAAALLPLAGCHVDADKNNGNDKVEISTPFGGMSVKTNEDAAKTSTGMAVYPGATLLKKDHGDDSGGAADVNMNFGSFHLGVKALSYRTNDDPSKVLAFYNKDMSKFGTVLHCKDNKPINGPDVTQDGLTCTDDKHRHGKIQINTDSDSDEEQLKAGSMRHQHIVAVNQKDGYTKISLIALDLPGGFTDSDSGSSQ